MLKFISFGSGSCGNCYYLSNGESAILIDAGVGIRSIKKLFREYGLNLSKIKGILITHDHADHIKAVGMISGDLHLPVFTTELIHAGIDRNFRVRRKLELPDRKMIENETTFEVGPFRITPFLLPHDASENMGYSIEVDGKTFCIMTDVGKQTENVDKYIRSANYLVLESNYDAEMLRTGKYPQILQERIRNGHGHLCNDQTAQILVDNIHPELERVWLCHLSEENNHPELARKTIEGKLHEYGIIAGKDFMLDVLKRKGPTGPFFLNGEEAVQLDLFNS